MTTTPLVPIMLFGWVPLTIMLFFWFPPHRAVLFSLIGGWLFLPTTGYDIQGLPAYSKSTAIALGLIFGGWISGKRQEASLDLKIYDIPMILWCLCPIATSLSNNLGLYNGLSEVTDHIVNWGVPYFTGRVYFTSPETLKDLCIGIVIGGMIYSVLCLYEIRMSPQLNKTVYGFFPHEWRQHYRYGGWRPIVFMQHGLMVALWMALTSTVAFWLWRGKVVLKMFQLPVSLIAAVLIITAILCKSASGLFALVIGCSSYFISKLSTKRNIALIVLILIIPLYIGFRITGSIDNQAVSAVASLFFNPQRVESLNIRLYQEVLFIDKGLKKLSFGWGGYSRGRPVDPKTDQEIKAVDSLWLIVFSSNGFFGLATLFFSILIGPWKISKLRKEKVQDYTSFSADILSIILVLFFIDSLFNAMINPVYILIAGTLYNLEDMHEYSLYLRAEVSNFGKRSKLGTTET